MPAPSPLMRTGRNGSMEFDGTARETTERWRHAPVFMYWTPLNLIFQVFHAIPEMTGPDGQPTQAVFGIFRDLLNIVRDRKPDYLAAAFDGPGRVFRSDIYEDYKANRKEMPVDLVPQIPVIRRVFEGFRVPVLTVPEMEADDIIATLTRRAEERGSTSSSSPPTKTLAS